MVGGGVGGKKTEAEDGIRALNQLHRPGELTGSVDLRRQIQEQLDVVENFCVGGLRGVCQLDFLQAFAGFPGPFQIQQKVLIAPISQLLGKADDGGLADAQAVGQLL